MTIQQQSSIDQIDAAGAPRRVLPAGGSGTLWSSTPKHGIVEFRGRHLDIVVPDPDEVLFPTDCGLSLVAALHRDHSVPIEGKNVLDIGSGSGLYAIAMLAAGAGQVTALDINPAAAEVTAENARRNGLDNRRLTCVTGDLADFQPDRRFDLVVANPPHLPYDDRYSDHGGLETALVGGADGRLLYDLLVSRADDLLREGGVMVVAHSSLADIARTIEDMSARGFVHQTIEVCEMDIPLVRYAEHRETVLARLAVLRELGCASFDGKRFWVSVLAFSRSRRPGK